MKRKLFAVLCIVLVLCGAGVHPLCADGTEPDDPPPPEGGESDKGEEPTEGGNGGASGGGTPG
jgi:hypothetical protein